ncbi:Very-long-chain_enoyl-CoA reductase [Hexamita inflata]|uniref:Very-long-chain enoyl-CoA reductase n=1 Tax=Hexamita inflata TaxID=28002 RepID=A0AA86PTK0_9EUKA|nr:Very-long-chain enoyl-CoA reductase [Hexamita inflata]
MQIEVSFKNDKKKVEIVDQMQSSEFMANVAKAFKQKPSRTRIQVESSDAKKIYLTPAKPLSAQVSENTRLVLKYVGPQINYRTVFILEYLGPITVMGGGIAFSCLLCEQLYIKIFCHFQCG